MSTGLRDLDTLTLGLSSGLYLLAASTGTGKTALAGQIALHVGEHHGPVVFVSIELTDVDLAVRLVSVLTSNTGWWPWATPSPCWPAVSSQATSARTWWTSFDWP